MTAPAVELASTGISGLDDILRGGLPRRRIYLLQGDPGVGKTTLGLQFLLEGAAKGEAGLYVTLSETEEELRAVASSHGWSLDALTLHQLSSVEERLAAQQQNTLFHPSDVELNETVDRVLALVEKVNPSRVVFDSLSEMRLLAGEPLRYRRQILALKQHFAGRNGTVLFLDDGTSGEADIQLQSLAHGVIALHKVSPEFGATKRKLEVVKLRGVDFRTGLHDYAIETSGLVVYPRLVAAEHRGRVERKQMPSAVPGLDALLGGGLERGNSVLFVGPSGSGKSTVAAQYVRAALERGERTAIFTFDETIGTFFARAEGTGMNLASFERRGLLTVRQVDPAELSPGQFAHAIRNAVERENARLVVIDSLNGYLMAMPDERFLVIQMHELLSYLSQKGVTTVLVTAQHGLVGTMQAPVDMTYLADSVVLFRFFEAEGKVRRAISVLKKRIGAHEDSIRELKIGAEGVTLGEPLSQFRGVLTGTPHFAGPEVSSKKDTA